MGDGQTTLTNSRHKMVTSTDTIEEVGHLIENSGFHRRPSQHPTSPSDEREFCHNFRVIMVGRQDRSRTSGKFDR
jgi:hypothetical protein